MKVRFQFVLLFLFSIFGLATNAQSVRTNSTGVLVGSVADMAESAPISYAFVLIHGKPGGQDMKAKLDANGRFDLQLTPGLYDIFVSADGFAPLCKKIKISAGQTTRFNVKLKPDSEHLESNFVIPDANEQGSSAG